MKVYFTCSTAEFKKYRDNYFIIRDYLISQGHILTRDWLPHTEVKIQSGNMDLRDIKQIYKDCIEAIKQADIVIIDDTISNFSTGHQITIALQLKKPVLVLWQGKKYRQFNQMFIHGIDSDLLEVSEYALGNLTDIIQSFINKYEGFAEKNRFHLVLNSLERNYLDWVQFNRGKSRTKVIKESLREIIDNDKEYKKYLSNK